VAEQLEQDARGLGGARVVVDDENTHGCDAHDSALPDFAVPLPEKTGDDGDGRRKM
jgi:hypothetical protein